MRPETTALPPLPLASWRATKETLHLWTQIVGKVRLALAPWRNHWWHVTLRPTPRGLTTGLIPHKGGCLEVEFDFGDHALEVRTSEDGRARIALHEGLSVAEFHRRLFEHLRSFGVRPVIRAVPYDLVFAKKPFAKDQTHAAYDAAAVQKFATLLRFSAGTLERFAGTFEGKTSPVHFFWHSFDLALTCFSGRRAPAIPGANAVTQEAYSQEVASFGFWPGDANTAAPAFYAYAAPVPEGLRDEPLRPSSAHWAPGTGMAQLNYEPVRRSRDPAQAVGAFYASVLRATQKRGRWPDA